MLLLEYLSEGSAGTELKAKNISKKVTKPPKTVSLSVSTGFLMRDSLCLVVQRSLTMSNIYLNFLELFKSRVPLLFKSGTLLIPNSNSDARRSRDLHSRGGHMTLFQAQLH